MAVSSPRALSERISFDPGVAGLAALGVERSAQLFGTEELGVRRAESLDGDRLVRYPLPGTPTRADGPLRGKPAGSGTGWVLLERFRQSGWGDLLRARFTHPRSASLAERRWNLLCHLRAHGVGTPEPLCVGARGDGPVSRTSFLVTRELVEVEPLRDFLAREDRPKQRERGLRSFAAFLSKLVVARVSLPAFSADDLVISLQDDADEEEGGSCSFRATPLPTGLPRHRLPSVMLARVQEGSLQSKVDPEQARSFLSTLRSAGLALRPGEGVRLCARALRHLAPSARRALISSL